jgi:hypothetical protein
VVRIDEDEEGTVWIFTNPGLAQWQNGRLIRVAPEPGSAVNPYLTTSNHNIGADGYLFGLWRLEAQGWQRVVDHMETDPITPEEDPETLDSLSSQVPFSGRVTHHAVPRARHKEPAAGRCS